MSDTQATEPAELTEPAGAAGAEGDGGGGASAPADAASETNGKRPPRARRIRGVIAWVLIVLASLLIPISILSAWAISTITNTDQYVATMAPLARDPIIVNHLATKATDALFSTHVVQNKVSEVLPAKAKPIVQPIVSEVKTYVHGIALQVLESEQFGKLWDTLNRHTHDAVVDILTGKQSALTKKLEKGGAIALNLSPALNNIIDKANSRGVTLFNPLKAVLSQNGSLSFTVVTQQQVSKFSGIFNLVVKLGWAVPVTAVLLGLIGVAVAVRRRKTLLRLSIGVALMTIVLLVALSLGRNVFTHQAAVHHLDGQVAATVWDTILRFLKADLRWMLLGAVIVAFFAWVFGPARYAVWIRRHVAAGARWVADQARALSGGAGRAAAESERARHVGGWIVEHLAALRIVGVIVAGLFLVFNGNLTGWSLLVILIVLAVYLGLLQLVVLWARKVAGPLQPSGPA
ncbi:MAG TPA: hypothetical protein VIX84_19320 [Acidimicrobiales bacterium]